MENVTSLAKIHLLTERYPAAKLVLKADKCLRTLVFRRSSWHWIDAIVIEMRPTDMCICKLTLENENDSLDDGAVYNWTFVVVTSPNANWIKFRQCLRFSSIKYNRFVSKQHFNTSCSSLPVCLSLWLLFIAGLANRAFSWTGVSTFFVWNFVSFKAFVYTSKA